MEVDDLRDLVRNARKVLVLTGAGMSAELGVDTYWSGPNAKYGETASPFGYTALEHANAYLWSADPESQRKYFEATYAHMRSIDLNKPSSAYRILREGLEKNNQSFFFATTNVDGFFARSGFPEESIYEIHGSYRYSQCLEVPLHPIFATPISPSPVFCPVCEGPGRPNALFFDDYRFNPARVEEQQDRMQEFEESMTPFDGLILEIGAGNTIPTIRNMSVIGSSSLDLPVIRINPNEVVGVDGIAGMLRKSSISPFVSLKTPASLGLKFLYL